MTKYIKIISMLFLVVLSGVLTSCTNNLGIQKMDQYSCLVLDSANDQWEIPIEYIKNYGYFESDTAPKETTIIGINGQKHVGQYNQSRFQTNYFYQVDEYMEEDGSSFTIRSDTGKPASFFFIGSETYYETAPLLPDLDNTASETLRLASEAASEFINTEEYELIQSEDESTYNISGIDYTLKFYYYNFIKKIDDINTTDMVRVVVDSKGFVTAMQIFRIGEFEKYKDYDVPMESCEEIIEEKVKGIYKDKYVSHEIQDLTLTLTEENQLALIARVPVNIKEGDTNYSTGVELIIILD